MLVESMPIVEFSMQLMYVQQFVDLILLLMVYDRSAVEIFFHTDTCIELINIHLHV